MDKPEQPTQKLSKPTMDFDFNEEVKKIIQQAEEDKREDGTSQAGQFDDITRTIVARRKGKAPEQEKRASTPHTQRSFAWQL